MGGNVPYLGLVLTPVGVKLRTRATEGLNETARPRSGVWEGVVAAAASMYYGSCIVSVMLLVGQSFPCRISDTDLFKKW